MWSAHHFRCARGRGPAEIRAGRRRIQHHLVEHPTVFRFRNLRQSDIGWLDGQRRHSTEEGRPLSDMEYLTLAFRLALREVENLGPHTVQHAPIGSRKSVATMATVDEIHAAAGKLGDQLILEFGVHVIERARGLVDPL